MSMLFHTHCPGACAIIQGGADGSVVWRPDAPVRAIGNQWFRFLVGVAASERALTVELQWLDSGINSGSDYSDCDNFAEV